MSKVCKKCGIDKPLSEWNRNSGRSDGLAVYCKICVAEYHRAWRARPEVKERQARLAAERYAGMSDEDRAEYIRAGIENRRSNGYNLQSKYGITIADYEALLKSQNGGCAICGKAPSADRRLSVDHDHSCCSGRRTCGGCLRGLLCTTCNSWLGFYETKEWTLKASEYLSENLLTKASPRD